MSCSPFDIRDYVLKELTNPQQLQVESHVKTCAVCREELESLRTTEMALFSLRDEEIPQRIAFISDKIFEPSPARRWLAALWGSTARLGFASAAMLSFAIAYSAWHRTPAPAPGTATVTTPVAVAAQTLTPEEIDRRVQDAVVKAVTDVESRYAERERVQLAEFRQAAEDAKRQLILAQAAYDKNELRQKYAKLSAMVRPEENGEVK